MHYKKIISILLLLVSCGSINKSARKIETSPEYELIKLNNTIYKFNNYRPEFNTWLLKTLQIFNKNYSGNLNIINDENSITCKYSDKKFTFPSRYRDSFDFSKRILRAASFLGKSMKQKYSNKRKNVIYLLCKSLVESLGNNSKFYTPDQVSAFKDELDSENASIGIKIKIIKAKIQVISVYPNGPAEMAGIKKGDVISTINNKKPDNNSHQIYSLLKGKSNTYVKIGIIDNSGMGKIKSVQRKIFKLNYEIKKLKNKITYVKFPIFDDDNIKFITKLKDESRGLILDLRNNNGGRLQLVLHLCSFFKGKEIATYLNTRDNYNPVYTKKRQKEFPDIPLVVLINEGTASGAELLASFLKKTRNAFLLGTRTYGSNTLKCLYGIGNAALNLTIGKMLTSDKIDFNTSGINPDISFPIESGLIEKAIDIINKANKK